MVTLSGWQGVSTMGSTDACRLEMFGGVVSGGIVGSAVGGGEVKVGERVGKGFEVDVGASVPSGNGDADADGDGDGEDVSSG